jgi:hypothetical protein
MTDRYSERTSDTKPSEMFMNALSGYGTGSDHITCGWCCREHYCPDTDYNHYDDDECSAGESRYRYRQFCEEEQKKNPNGVVLHDDCDGISATEMNGVMFVLSCPCNGLQRYEHFIWQHRQTIRNYLKCRIEQEAIWAEEELTLNKLAGI